MAGDVDGIVIVDAIGGLFMAGLAITERLDLGVSLDQFLWNLMMLTLDIRYLDNPQRCVTLLQRDHHLL